MSIDYALGLILTIGLSVYLIHALLCPERY